MPLLGAISLYFLVWCAVIAAAGTEKMKKRKPSTVIQPQQLPKPYIDAEFTVIETRAVDPGFIGINDCASEG